MDAAKLEQIGLNRNEAIIYLELTKLGSTSAGELIKKTGFHRNIVYDNLEKLIEKGLATFIVRENKRMFQSCPPEMLFEMIEKEQNKLNKKKLLAEKIKEEVNFIYAKSGATNEAVVFRGITGIKALLNDTIKEKTDYCIFGAPESSLSLLRSSYWKNYNKRLISKKIIARMIFNNELRKWSKNIKNKNTIIKFLPEHFDSLTETIIYGNSVAIIIWTETPTGVLIRDPEAARGYKQYFEMLWRIAIN